MALYTCILQNQIDIYHQILIKMLTREPVAFFCYFSSFELMTKGKKEIIEKIQNLVQQNHYLILLSSFDSSVTSPPPQDKRKIYLYGMNFFF